MDISRCYNCGSDKHFSIQCPHLTSNEEMIGSDPNCKKCFGKGKIFMIGGPAQPCDCFLDRSTPKEGGVEPAIPNRRCKYCPCYLMQHEHEVCDTCLKARRQCVSERRARFERAYMAALGGVCADTNVANPVKDAHALALETVRQWDAMMAELEEM